MKTLTVALAISFFSLIHMRSFAQSDVMAFLKDTEWLEGQLNTLSKGKKSSAAESFEFDACLCKYVSKTDNGGFNFSKSNDFNLKEVSMVSYAKNEDGTYELRMKMKTDSDIVDALDLGAINVILHTSDEKLIKEIVHKLRTSIKTCSAAGKKSVGEDR